MGERRDGGGMSGPSLTPSYDSPPPLLYLAGAVLWIQRPFLIPLLPLPPLPHLPPSPPSVPSLPPLPPSPPAAPPAGPLFCAHHNAHSVGGRLRLSKRRHDE